MQALFNATCLSSSSATFSGNAALDTTLKTALFFHESNTVVIHFSFSFPSVLDIVFLHVVI